MITHPRDAAPRDINSVDTLRVAIRGLEKAGLSSDAELRRAGAVVVEGTVREGLSRDAYCQLWTRMSAAAGRDDFGLLLSGEIETGILGPLESLATTAPTLGAGLEALARCGRLLHTGGHYALERRRDEASFVYYAGPTSPPRVLLDWSLTYLLRTLRRVVPTDVGPSAVQLQYRRPSRSARIEETFGAPVWFDAPSNAIVFPREQLDAPLVTHDPGAHATFDALCRARCAVSRDVASRVKHELLQHLAREQLPAIEHVARVLSMSARSLQRALATQGASFRQLVMEARMETAERWRADPRRRTADVAYGLGYSEPSAFSRAYRAHFGRPFRHETSAV